MAWGQARQGPPAEGGRRTMPMFEYECQECGRRFETFVTASRKTLCPQCQSEKLKKLVSAVGRIGGRSSAGGGFTFGGG